MLAYKAVRDLSAEEKRLADSFASPEKEKRAEALKELLRPEGGTRLTTPLVDELISRTTFRSQLYTLVLLRDHLFLAQRLELAKIARRSALPPVVITLLDVNDSFVDRRIAYNEVALGLFLNAVRDEAALPGPHAERRALRDLLAEHDFRDANFTLGGEGRSLFLGWKARNLMNPVDRAEAFLELCDHCKKKTQGWEKAAVELGIIILMEPREVTLYMTDTDGITLKEKLAAEEDKRHTREQAHKTMLDFYPARGSVRGYLREAAQTDREALALDLRLNPGFYMRDPEKFFQRLLDENNFPAIRVLIGFVKIPAPTTARRNPDKLLALIGHLHGIVFDGIDIETQCEMTEWCRNNGVILSDTEVLRGIRKSSQ